MLLPDDRINPPILVTGAGGFDDDVLAAADVEGVKLDEAIGCMAILADRREVSCGRIVLPHD